MTIFGKSTILAVLALIIANLLPMVGVFFSKMRPENLLFLYFLETWIIGFYNIFKIRKASAAITPQEEKLLKAQLFAKSINKISSASIALLFTLQYVVVVLMYGAALFLFFIPAFFAEEARYSDRIAVSFPTLQQIPNFILLLFTLVASHGISYAVNYIGKREFEKVSPVHQMLQPYDRILAMHFFVLLGTMIFGTLKNIGLTFRNELFSTVGLVFIKLIADLAAHMKEHMILIRTEPIKPKTPEIIKTMQGKAPFWIKRSIIFTVVAVVIAGSVTLAANVKKSHFQLSRPPILVTNQPEYKESAPTVSLNEVVPAVITQTKASSKLHVVFISSNYSDLSKFQSDAKKLQQYLLSFEPYSEFASIFQFHLLETQFNFDCQDVVTKDEAYVGGELVRIGCNGQIIHQVIQESKFPYNRIVVLIDNTNIHGRDTVNGFMVEEWGGIPSDENIVLVNTSRGSIENVFIHEFNHSFGIADEYLLYQVPGPEGDFCPDNCCHNNKCTDWKDINGALCLPGCSYPNWYRSSEDSIMKSTTGKLNQISLDILRRRLRKFTDPELVTGSVGWSWDKYRPVDPGAYTGDLISFSGETWNRGAKTTNQSFMSGHLDIGNDGTWDIEFPAVSVATLSPDMTQTHFWRDVWIAKVGNHRFEICVDVTNMVEEANEKNNCKPLDFTVRDGSAN